MVVLCISSGTSSLVFFSSGFLLETISHCLGLSRKTVLLSVKLSLAVEDRSPGRQSWLGLWGWEKQGRESPPQWMIVFMFLLFFLLLIDPHGPGLATRPESCEW